MLEFFVDISLVMVYFLWIHGDDFVVHDYVGLDHVKLVGPPAQGESFVGVLDDLGLRAKHWKRDVLPQ